MSCKILQNDSKYVPEILRGKKITGVGTNPNFTSEQGDGWQIQRGVTLPKTSKALNYDSEQDLSLAS